MRSAPTPPASSTSLPLAAREREGEGATAQPLPQEEPKCSDIGTINRVEKHGDVVPEVRPEGCPESETPSCVVSHPDAGGPCGRPAIGEVWSLPFYELHGAEAEAAVLDEITEDLEKELEILADAKQQRHLPNRVLVRALEQIATPAISLTTRRIAGGLSADPGAHGPRHAGVRLRA